MVQGCRRRIPESSLRNSTCQVCIICPAAPEGEGRRRIEEVEGGGEGLGDGQTHTLTHTTHTYNGQPTDVGRIRLEKEKVKKATTTTLVFFRPPRLDHPRARGHWRGRGAQERGGLHRANHRRETRLRRFALLADPDGCRETAGEWPGPNQGGQPMPMPCHACRRTGLSESSAS